MDMHRPLLADAKCAAGALVFHGRVPPARQMDYMVRARQRQSHSARTRGQDERVESPWRRLEAINALLATVTCHFATDDRGRSGKPVAPLDNSSEPRLHVEAVEKDQSTFACSSNAVESVETNLKPRGGGDEL